MKGKNKIFFWIISSVALILFLSLIYFFFFSSSEFTGGIISAHFETFPEGTEMGPGMTGMMTNSFNQNDLVGISGEADVNKNVELTFEIYDVYGNKVESYWEGDFPTINSGNFGFCCINIPQESGYYTMKLFLNGKESRTMLFDVRS